jgi:phosphoserine phosphatase
LGLVALDFDGVLVRQPSAWGTLHEAFGTEEAARRNFREFERGEFDYVEFMRRDISLWGRRSHEEIRQVLFRYDLDPEAESVVAEWKREGRQIAVISSGIDTLVGEVARRLGIECFVANGLETDAHGNLTGNGILRVDLRRKDVALRRVADSLGCPLEAVVSVGDSPFDLPALRASGLGIGYGDRTRVGPLSGLVDAWADTLGDISRIIREFEKSPTRPSGVSEGDAEGVVGGFQGHPAREADLRGKAEEHAH